MLILLSILILRNINLHQAAVIDAKLWEDFWGNADGSEVNVDRSLDIIWALSNTSRDILLPEVLYFHLEVNSKAGFLVMPRYLPHDFESSMQSLMFL